MEISNLNQKKREHYIDIGKGVAMILVILGHCALTPNTLKWWLYSFHMPLFFVLSGLVFNPHKYEKFTAFLKARLKSLIVPYFMLSFFLWVWKDIIRHKTTFLTRQNTLDDFIGIFLGHRGTDYYFSMWFLTATFVAEMILYFVSKLTKDKIWALLLSSVGFSVLSWFILENIDVGFYLSLDLVPIAVSFIAIGYILRLKKEKTEILFHPLFFPFAVVVNVITAYLNHKICGRVDLYSTRMGNYFYCMLAAVAGCWAVIIVCKAVKKLPPIEYIGRNSLIYYAFQNAVFIGSAEKIVKHLATLGGFWANRYIMLIIAVLLACIGLAVWAECINKAFPILMGRPVKRIKKAPEEKKPA